MLIDARVKRYLRKHLVIGLVIESIFMYTSVHMVADGIFPMVAVLYPLFFLGALLWDWPTADIEAEGEFDDEDEKEEEVDESAVQKLS